MKVDLETTLTKKGLHPIDNIRNCIALFIKDLKQYNSVN